VAAVETDPLFFTLQVRLADIFGDNGMISVVICRQTDNKTWEFDTWLMSCRVLGRRVQEAVLQEVLKHAELNGIRTLIGVYKPTERNQMVEEHYRLLGFESTSGSQDGSTTWLLQVQNAKVKGAAMLVRSIGFETVQI
jgi:FkbH-like protein